MRVFLCCNDLTGRSTGYLISVYVEDLAFLKGEPLECSYDNVHYWIDVRHRFFCNDHRLNDDQQWDELIMPTRYVVKMLRMLKKKGWDGEIDLDFYPHWRVEDGRGITVDVIEGLWAEKIGSHHHKGESSWNTPLKNQKYLF
jgi:hypothetical protein